METDRAQKLANGDLTGGSLDTVRSPSVLIRPLSGRVPLSLRDLWEYRELLYFLTWRDIKVRYKQTILGVAWAILQPVFLMIIFTLFFGRLIGVPSNGLPYSVFAYTALLAWQLFSRGLNDVSMSLVGNERLISKIYFPRILIPASAVLSSLIDFLIAFFVLIGLMTFYGITPGLAIVALPLFVFLAVAAALGVGLWLAALNVIYRDVRHVLPLITQIWMFATPIIYPVSLVPETWRPLYSINPLVGVVEGFRWSLLAISRPEGFMIGLSVSIVIAVLIGGVFYFQRAERVFADVI